MLMKKQMRAMKVNEISNLINIRNYIMLQVENTKTDKKVSLRLLKILNDLDISLNENILDLFSKKEKESKKQNNDKGTKQTNI